MVLTGSLARILETSSGKAAWMTVFLDIAHRFSVGFERIFLETVPFLLLGAFASAIVAHIFTNADIQALFTGRTLRSVLMGILAAVILPVGDGGSVLLARQLLRKGAGVPAAAGLMLAGPGVNLIAVGAGLATDGMAGLTGMRFAVAVLFALVFGLILSQENEPERLICTKLQPVAAGNSASLPGLEGTGRGGTAKTVALTAAREFLEFMPLLVMAAFIGALLQALIPAGWIPPIPGSVPGQFAGAGLWAVLTAQSAVGDLYTIQAGSSSWTAGAQWMYLLVGMAVDIKLILFYGRIFRRKALLYWILLVLSMSMLASLAIGIVGGVN